jgi:hypothetical protein
VTDDDRGTGICAGQQALRGGIATANRAGSVK